MTAQLELIDGQTGGPGDGQADWQLDEQTREAGRRGVEQARAALAEARRRLHDDPSPTERDRAA